MHPEVAATLDRVVIMGGSATVGNTTAAAEFNVWSDPEAAYRVLTDPGLDRPVPTTMVGLDLTLTVPVHRGRPGRWLAGGRAAGQAAAAMLRPEAERQRPETGVAALPCTTRSRSPPCCGRTCCAPGPATITVDCSDGPTPRRHRRRACAGRVPGREVAVGAAARDIVDLIVRRVADYSS